MLTISGVNWPELPQFGIPAGEPKVINSFQVGGALGASQVWSQRFAGGALAQHAVAAGAALEVDLLGCIQCFRCNTYCI
jgi:hypothetical protein